jgi:WD40 repeat protein
VAVSPDGKLVAVVSHRLGEAHATVEVWDVPTGKRVRHFREPGANYQCVAFSPDGTRLAGGGNSNLIKVWDVGTGQEVALLRGHQGIDLADPDPVSRGIERLTFSPDGFALVSEGKGVVKVWDLASPPGHMQLEHGGDVLLGLNFSPDGRWLLVTRSDDDPRTQGVQFLRLYDARTGAPMQVFRRPPWRAGEFSPDGRWVFTRNAQGKVQVRDVPAWQVHLELTGAWAEFDSSGKLLFEAGLPSGSPPALQCRVWSVEAKKELYQLPVAGPHLGFFHPFSPDDKRLLCPNEAGLLGVFEARTGKPLYEIKATLANLRYHFSPDSSLFVTTRGNDLELRESGRGEVRHTLALGEPLGVYDFTEDGKWLTALGKQGTVKAWETATGKEVAALTLGEGDNRLHGPGERVLRPKWTTRKVQGRDVVLLEVTCWDLRTGRQTVTKVDHLGSGRELVSFSPDGRRLACIRGANNAVELWDLITGQQILALPGWPMFRRLVAFSPDGTRLAAGGIDLALWDAAEPAAGQVAARFEAAALSRAAMHVQEANKAIDERRPQAAVFHLDRLLERRPDAAQLRTVRAGLQAERGLWDEAVLDLRLALRGGTPDPALLPQYALALYRSGDREGWQRFCAELVERNADSDKPAVLDAVLRSCLLAPEALQDEGKLVPLAEKLAKAVGNGYHGKLTAGAALHRAGRYDQAVEELEAAKKLTGGNAVNLPEHLLFLALARKAQKQDKEAGEALAEASRIVRMLTTTPELPLVFQRPPWYVLARYELLREEAQALLEDKPARP